MLNPVYGLPEGLGVEGAAITHAAEFSYGNVIAAEPRRHYVRTRHRFALARNEPPTTQTQQREEAEAHFCWIGFGETKRKGLCLKLRAVGSAMCARMWLVKTLKVEVIVWFCCPHTQRITCTLTLSCKCACGD